MPRHERSAGFIVFADADADHPEREFLLLDAGRHWEFAKGHDEAGEDDLAAARRELAEEAGIVDVDVIPGFAHEIEYFFRARQGLIHKTVIYFLGRAKSRAAQVSHEHVGLAWLPASAAIERVTFATAKQVLRDAIAFLESTRTEAT
jgi:8-oxo-dGTP pyrophosphatase MutT (NUDIX family)